MLSVRPKIAELVFQLYGRSLHPELFEVYRSRRVQRGRVAPRPAEPRPATGSNAPSRDYDGYEADVRITSAGHVVTWRHGGLTLTEVCVSSHQPMPLKRRLLSQSVQGERTERLECRGGVVYEATFSLEVATADTFRTYQQEFDLLSLQSAAPGAPESGGGLFHRFEASSRAGLKLGAVSYIDCHARDRALRVRALHTFPDDRAIVKSESVFRLPG